MNMAGGLLAGLVLGIAAAIGREQLDRTIKSPDDLAPLGLTYLGLLPRIDGGIHGDDRAPYARRRKGRRTPADLSDAAVVPELMVNYAPHSATAEAARAIRTNILFMSPDVPYRRLLVTSAVPSEGKTTVACSIAIAMAQAGQRVALVDCDLRRPRLHRIFGKPNETGLTTVLLDPEVLDSAITSGEVPGLHLLTSGPIPPNPAELLHSEAFGRVLQELEKRFDRVIFDSPPLIPVTDAAVLSTRVDATVLVVKPFLTRKEVARHAVRSLRDVGGRILGTVLNDLDLSSRDSSYYYQYHSRYYHAYRQDSPAPPDDAPGASS
jgi:capsular exopolysaccharide synthesis family protein